MVRAGSNTPTRGVRCPVDRRSCYRRHSSQICESHSSGMQGVVFVTAPFLFARRSSRCVIRCGWKPSSPDRKARHAHPCAQRGL